MLVRFLFIILTKMFSNLFYLSKLIDTSLILSDIDKMKIFIFAKENPSTINDFIKIFKEEKIGFDYIKNDYQQKVIELWKSYDDALLNRKVQKEESHITDIKNKLNKIKDLEKEEHELELNLLYNNI